VRREKFIFLASHLKGNGAVMKYFLVMLLIMFAFFFLQATEIYGIIDEDTTIGPEGNPWYVTHNLTVNEDATLTILPGTEIYVTAAYTDDFYNFVANNSGEAEAKVITIYGNILAIGTEADSILFTRSPDYPHFRWGGIRLLSDCPELNTFKHSIIEYTAFVYDNIGVPPLGIASKPGITIENCYFQDNAIGIQLFDLENIIYYPTKINGCYFYTTDESIIFETGNDTGIQLFINDSDVMTQISNCILLIAHSEILKDRLVLRLLTTTIFTAMK